MLSEPICTIELCSCRNDRWKWVLLAFLDTYLSINNNNAHRSFIYKDYLTPELWKLRGAFVVAFLWRYTLELGRGVSGGWPEEIGRDHVQNLKGMTLLHPTVWDARVRLEDKARAVCDQCRPISRGRLPCVKETIRFSKWRTESAKANWEAQLFDFRVSIQAYAGHIIQEGWQEAKVQSQSLSAHPEPFRIRPNEQWALCWVRGEKVLLLLSWNWGS